MPSSPRRAMSPAAASHGNALHEGGRLEAVMGAVPVLALAVLAVLVAVTLGALGSADRGTSLTGTWMARTADGVERPIDLPVDFADVGLPLDAPVTISMPLELQRAVEEPALLLEHPHHSVEVWFEGKRIGTMPGGNTPRSDRPVFRLGPDVLDPGRYEIEVVVTGAYRQAGIAGDVRLGSAPLLSRSARGLAGERLALSAMLALTSLLGLVIASVRPGQREFLWFGLFCAGAMGTAFAGDDAWWLASDRLDLRLRIQVASYLLLPGTGALFLQYILSPTKRTAPAVLLNAGLVVGAFALLWPDVDVLATVARVADVLAVAGVFLVTTVLIPPLRRGSEGASSLALAVAILLSAAILERLSLELGSVSPRLLLPGFLLFIGTASAAMVLRSTDLADRYRQLVSSARDVILVVLPDGTIEEGNHAAVTVLGPRLIGEPLASFLDGVESTELRSHLAGGEGRVRRSDLRLRTTGDRTLHVESVATDLPDRRVLLVLRDLTARRNAEEGLLHAARMETVGIIAGGIAHDFNNTMTALMAHIGLLKLKVEDKDKQRLDRMEAVIRRAAHMTRRLLTLARGGESQRVPVNPAQPVHSAVELTRSMLPGTVRLKERIDPDIPAVLASADDLEQAALNLLVNARDALAAHGGGTIRVRVRFHREPDLPAAVRIIVEDDGPGVPLAVRDAIWEPFFTTKGEGRGTGLGLSVVTRVIREHGGTIVYQDRNPDAADGRVGARFTITLPAAREVEPDTLGSEPATRGRRVLVVDDEEEIRALLKAELANRGFVVSAAASGEEALAAAVSADPPFEILVTDVVMGELDGIELARRVCEAAPETRVVVCSGFIPEHLDALEPEWLRVDKPFTIEEVIIALRRSLLALPDPSDDVTVT